MKVAIIGAGLSGIICALQLQKYRIVPDIYERKNVFGEEYRHVGAALEIALRPIQDPLQYINEKYDIYLKPSGLIRRIIHKSPHAKAKIKGNLGYFLIRGADPDSVESQLVKNLKSRIMYGNEADYKKLKKKYDYVVVATGYPTEARELGIWQDAIKMSIQGAVISGKFDSDTFIVWLNKNYCKSGYAYLAPITNKKASLILAVDEIEPESLDSYWSLFLKTEKLRVKIIEKFQKVHYSGFVYPHRVDNLYFIGNAAGCLDPLLGFGIYTSVVTASEAAKSIALGTDYECGIQKELHFNDKMYEFRKAFNKLDNKGYDHLIRLLRLPGVNTLIYKWKKINVVSLGYQVLKRMNNISPK